jgi:large subunit ribosomal protein L24
MNIKKDDKVIVLTGVNKGQTGKILKVLRDENKVVIEGINVRKKHQKPVRGHEGKIVEINAPLNASNVALIDTKTGKPTRIGFEMKDGKKVRISRRSGAKI